LDYPPQTMKEILIPALIDAGCVLKRRGQRETTGKMMMKKHLTFLVSSKEQFRKFFSLGVDKDTVERFCTRKIYPAGETTELIFSEKNRPLEIFFSTTHCSIRLHFHFQIYNKNDIPQVSYLFK
jgi:hypothetical protein